MKLRSLVLAASSALALHACDGNDYSLGHPAEPAQAGSDDHAAGGQETTGGSGGRSGGGAPSGGTAGAGRGGASGGSAGLAAGGTGGAAESGTGGGGLGGSSGSSATSGGSDGRAGASGAGSSGTAASSGEGGQPDCGVEPCVPRARTVVAGNDYSCALDETGSVKCWGAGTFGVLGYGNETDIGDDETPASIGYVDIGGTAVQMSGSEQHTCVLLTTSAVRCWGHGTDGSLGYGKNETIGDGETPASAGDVDIGGPVQMIAAGGHTCALLENGAVRCWGYGSEGQLGYGNMNAIGDDETPAVAGDVDVGGTVKELSVGSYHTCALLTTGAVRCWGEGFHGQLGYGNTNNIGDDETPSSAGDVDVGGPVQQISAGGIHTCALLTSGAVRCWGGNDFGELGYGRMDDIGDDETPASVGDVDVGGAVQQISAGLRHTCALLVTGAVRCWGDGGDGQLGYGNVDWIGNDETPASVGDIDFGRTLAAVAAGAFHTCVVTTLGAIRCTGYGTYGALGYGNKDSIGDDETPASAGSVPVF